MNISACVFVCFVISSIISPVFISARVAQVYTTCLANAKKLSMSMLVYGSDHDDRMPLAANWRSASAPNSSSLLCPQANSPWSYAMNRSMAAEKYSDVEDPLNTVLIFETDSQIENVVGGAESFVTRHGGLGTVAMTDSHTNRKKFSDPKLRWKP